MKTRCFERQSKTAADRSIFPGLFPPRCSRKSRPRQMQSRIAEKSEKGKALALTSLCEEIPMRSETRNKIFLPGARCCVACEGKQLRDRHSRNDADVAEFHPEIRSPRLLPFVASPRNETTVLHSCHHHAFRKILCNELRKHELHAALRLVRHKRLYLATRHPSTYQHFGALATSQPRGTIQTMTTTASCSRGPQPRRQRRIYLSFGVLHPYRRCYGQRAQQHLAASQSRSCSHFARVRSHQSTSHHSHHIGTQSSTKRQRVYSGSGHPFRVPARWLGCPTTHACCRHSIQHHTRCTRCICHAHASHKPARPSHEDGGERRSEEIDASESTSLLGRRQADCSPLSRCQRRDSVVRRCASSFVDGASIVSGGAPGVSGWAAANLIREAPLPGVEQVESIAREPHDNIAWREARVLTGYTIPIFATHLLELSLSVASVFSLGHLGTVELAAASLSSMTANVSGYSVLSGFISALDTLLPSALHTAAKVGRTLDTAHGRHLDGNPAAHLCGLVQC